MSLSLYTYSETHEDTEDSTSFVKESKELLQSFTRIGQGEQGNEEWCLTVLDQYQEQGQLLDPLLEGLVHSLMANWRGWIRGRDGKATRDSVFRVLASVCKVRGVKTVRRFLDHEARDLEPVVEALEEQDRAESESWQTRYCLLVWLSIIALVPFDIASIDSDLPDRPSVVERVVGACKAYLADPGKVREAAGELVARLLTRPDMRVERLASFMDWCSEVVAGSPSVFLATGVFAALAAVFKHGHRNELLARIDGIFHQMFRDPDSPYLKAAESNVVLRQLTVKLASRIALAYMPPRVASWRYQRGSRSLAANLAGVASGVVAAAPAASAEGDDSSAPMAAPPDQIEEIIGRLLEGLRDSDTVVRWSAAKGIGRLTNRLSMALGDQIVEAVADLLSENEDDGAWHGACLALAELARRGLLLPRRLDGVMPSVLKALHYDVRRGAYSVGAHVRDAACYVCWAFARAYAPEVMAPHVAKLAVALILATLFDREVNCRRAASAAFQENVGRQGNFPNGIEILTAADYFTVGNRTRAYTSIARYIAQFGAYRVSLLDHLAEVKTKHWDRAVRELAARALGELAPLAPAHAWGLADSLIPACYASDVAERHGAVLAVAETVLALCRAGHAPPGGDEQAARFRAVVPTIEKKRLYRGKGGEIMRGAACRLVECLALSSAVIPIPAKTLALLLASVEESLPHPTEDISQSAADALTALAPLAEPALLHPAVERLARSLADTAGGNAGARRGHALALGALPASVLAACPVDVLGALCAASGPEASPDPDARDAQSRRNAARGCARAAVALRRAALPVDLDAVLAALSRATEDYEVDNRGDVGSWVREEAVEGLAAVLEAWGHEHVPAPAATAAVRAILPHTVAKIDRLRERACEVFYRLLHLQPFAVAHRAELLAIFPAGLAIDWSAPSATFPLTVRLLDLEAYREPLLASLVCSVGGLTESLVRHSRKSLLDHLARGSAGALQAFADLCLAVCGGPSAGDPRVMVPLFKTMDYLIGEGVFDDPARVDSGLGTRLQEVCSREVAAAGKDFHRLHAAIGLLCSLVLLASSHPASAHKPKCLRSLMLLLGHRFPKIRRSTAEALRNTLLVTGDATGDPDEDPVTRLLTDTNWDGELADARQGRDALCDHMGIPRLIPKGDQSETRSRQKEKSNFEYRDLVDECGY
jgi:hypothetical protein